LLDVEYVVAQADESLAVAQGDIQQRPRFSVDRTRGAVAQHRQRATYRSQRGPQLMADGRNELRLHLGDLVPNRHIDRDSHYPLPTTVRGLQQPLDQLEPADHPIGPGHRNLATSQLLARRQHRLVSVEQRCKRLVYAELGRRATFDLGRRHAHEIGEGDIAQIDPADAVADEDQVLVTVDNLAQEGLLFPQPGLPGLGPLRRLVPGTQVAVDQQ